MTGKENLPDKEKNKLKGKRWIIMMILILILLLLFLGLYYLISREEDRPVTDLEGKDTGRTELQIIEKDSAAEKEDTLEIADTLKEEEKKIVKKKYIKPRIKKKEKPEKKIKDTASVDTAAEKEPLPDPCESDTIAPWVYPDPSGGLHYGKISVHFGATEPCTIEWKFKKDKEWKTYDNGTIIIDRNRVLCFRAEDSCGNKMDTRYEEYEIGEPLEKGICPDDMVFIKISTTKFCIDRYEWPNKKGRKPTSHISIYHAMDSCFTRDKRLCDTDEWSLACGGVYNWKYPYGKIYEPKACGTRDSTIHRSGSMPECRGYFEIYDMAGNLAEWTNTRSRKNSEFYNVMGGFWESGPLSTCFEPRYSYYPQNRHNPVGFRCCRDVNK